MEAVIVDQIRRRRDMFDVGTVDLLGAITV